MNIVAISVLIVSVIGILWLAFAASRDERAPTQNLYVVDVLKDVSEERLALFLSGYNDVLQITPTTWYVVSPLPMSDISERLINEYGDLRIAVYHVNNVLSAGGPEIRDWLLSRLNRGQ